MNSGELAGGHAEVLQCDGAREGDDVRVRLHDNFWVQQSSLALAKLFLLMLHQYIRGGFASSVSLRASAWTSRCATVCSSSTSSGGFASGCLA